MDQLVSLCLSVSDNLLHSWAAAVALILKRVTPPFQTPLLLDLVTDQSLSQAVDQVIGGLGDPAPGMTVEKLAQAKLHSRGTMGPTYSYHYKPLSNDEIVADSSPSKGQDCSSQCRSLDRE